MVTPAKTNHPPEFDFRLRPAAVPALGPTLHQPTPTHHHTAFLYRPSPKPTNDADRQAAANTEVMR